MYRVVEGVAVPAALASSFSDPRKRPFSYTKPLPPSVQARSARTFHFSTPRVLPIVPSEMPSNIQYNTPMPIYSRESAEEQYKQQVGVGPDHTVGSGERHFDPTKSETLKAIQAGEDDHFGRTFSEKIAEAEAPHIPPIEEPYWTRTARSKSERARSVTPSATYKSPTAQYSTPQYSTLQYPKRHQDKGRSHSASKRGYEFGGIDYVDRSMIPQDNTYVYFGDTHRSRDERHTTPGYEMGGMDFRKGHVQSNGPYHGHGPEHKKLHPKYEQVQLKRDEMNIELAPNVDCVSADILVGDTRSNQHISHGGTIHDHSFGTSFAPLPGFRREHRSVTREEESFRPTSFSLSAKKGCSDETTPGHRDVYSAVVSDGRDRPYDPTDVSGYTSQAVTDYKSERHDGDHRYASHHVDTTKSSEKDWTRSQSAAPAPAERYEWADEHGKEVTIETLLNGRALLPRRRSSPSPDWRARSLEKQSRWKDTSDPRLSRSQTHEYEPNWSKIVSSRRNAWEEKARSTDAKVQMSPSSKVPAQQPPYWYNKANQTHALWQSEADRQERADYRTTESSYSMHERRTEHSGGDFSHGQGVHSQTIKHQPAEHDRTQGYTDTLYEKNLKSDKKQQQQQKSSAFTSIEQKQYTKDSENFDSETAIPLPPSQQQPLSSSYYQSSAWHSQSTPTPFKKETRDEHYEEKFREQTSRRTTSTEPAGGIAPHSIQKTSYQQSTHREHHESDKPHTTSKVAVHQNAKDFDRRLEMAEVLPRGTIANTEASTEGKYLDKEGRPVTYRRELVTSVNPNSESTLLKEEERRVIETPLEPGVISRHVTTKYYKKKTITDTMTTTSTVQ